MPQLNAPQNKAVRYIDGPLLVLAGAGSGKTRVITEKIAYLIEKCGSEAKHIAAVTFTNKAAREMKARASALISKKKIKGLRVSTFHTLGLNILRAEYRKIGYKSGFSLFDQTDATALIQDLLIQEHGGDANQASFIQNQISSWKNDMVSCDQAIVSANSPQEHLCAQAYLRYQQSLTAYNAFDFDDLILRPVELFKEQPDCLERWQNRIRYLLVDEYQDTNGCQYQLVKQLVGGRNGLTVVGDDDQSIYSWRGANPENLTKLAEDFQGLEVVKLEQNYRSTARILRAANELIANNPHVFDKSLWSKLGNGDPIRILHTDNEDSESERIVTDIIDSRLKRGADFSQYAVLYRSNHQARLLEMKLQFYDVPYHISGGTSFFARNEIKDVMAYLRLLVNPQDDNAFLRIVNVPRRKIGISTLQTLGSHATERQISLSDACEEIGLQNKLTDSAYQRLHNFNQWISSTRRYCLESNPIVAIENMLKDIDYDGWIRQQASSDAIAENRLKNISFLIESLEKSLQHDDVEGIEAAIAKLILRDALEQQEEEKQSATSVQLMTLHASKGLEFPFVYLMGVEENILPHQNSIESDTVEEERRLFYVGITRAQQSLTCTLAKKRKQFGEKIQCQPSRFLNELPQQDIVISGNDNINPATSQKAAKETLSGLQGLFD